MKEKQKTFYPKPTDQKEQWVVVDAKDQVLGRLASNVASRIRGKHLAQFTPAVDMGDFVIVINAQHVRVTGNKAKQKRYYRHSGYPGGLTEITWAAQMQKDPKKVIVDAVKGMLPHNRLGRKLINKLKVYDGDVHPHEAQVPTQILA